MKLTINIKPSKKEGRSKAGATPGLLGVGGYSYSSYGHNVRGDDLYVYAMNFEKHRKKSQRFGVNGKKLKKAKITPAKWVCYYYRIPVSVLKDLNLRVVQGTRTFKIESIK